MPLDTVYSSRIRRLTFIFGVFQITFGCFVGFIPPSAVEWYRGIVMAHIEFTANGVLMVAFAFLVNEMALGRKMLTAWFTLLQIGTWTNGLAGLIAAFIGFSSKFMPSINEKFPAPHGSDHFLVTTSLLICGVTILLALFITLYGLIKKRA